MKDDEKSNGWSRYEVHVLNELEGLKKQSNLIFSKINCLSEDVAKLKVKSGIWGLLGGFIPAAIVALYVIFK